MGMPKEEPYPSSIPDYSPHQWMSHDVAGPAFKPVSETAVLDLGEANAAVAQAGSNRDGHRVLDVSNMSYPGTHRAGD
jgi:hypothetical protein